MEERQIQKYTIQKHILKRPERYIGNCSVVNREDFVFSKENHSLQFSEVTYPEAYYKMIDEVVDNAIDEGITSKIKDYTIKISLNSDFSIKVEDNGRGLSTEILDKDIDGNAIEAKPQAYYAFCSLQAGSNFDDNDRETTGLHGEGVSIVNILSSKFSVISKNASKKKFILNCSNNMSETDYTVLNNLFNKETGTLVEFTPDFSIIDVSNVKIEDVENHLYKRCLEIKQTYPDFHLYFNDSEITEKFFDFVDGNTLEFDGNFISVNFKNVKRKDISYINGIYTDENGTHCDAANVLIIQLFRELINKKFKLDFKPSFIKKFYDLVLFFKVKNARFANQNKSKFVGNFKEIYSYFANSDTFKNFILDCFRKNEEIFENAVKGILEANKNKKIAELQKQIKKKKEEFNPDYHDISGNDYKNATLFLFEGRSAISNFRAVRNSKVHAGMALRGKFINVYEIDSELDLLKNKVARNIISAADLNFENQTMKFKEIGICSDSDVDGDHIYILLMCFFVKFFPKLVEAGRIVRYKSPVIIATRGKDEKLFYMFSDYEKEKKSLLGYKIDYFKGLGSLEIEAYNKMINEPFKETIVLDKFYTEALKTAFDKSYDYVQLRKKWLTTGNFEVKTEESYDMTEMEELNNEILLESNNEL